MSPGFDIIGDIHGESEKLRSLLDALGYQESAGLYRHQNRKVIFVGDLVDRGPDVRGVLQIALRMVDAGTAYMVLGNHELNLINWFRPLGNTQHFARAHSKPYERQLSATLSAYPHNELEQIAKWLSYQPLFLEFPQFRVAHAVWDAQFVRRYLKVYSSCCLSPKVLAASDREPWLMQGIDRTTRGLNLTLPEGVFSCGNDGISRRRIRAKFWCEQPETYGDVVLQSSPLDEAVARLELTSVQRAQLVHYGASKRPLFVGHYWQSGEPKLMTSNIACVDYSAALGGQLMAYRWSQGDASLSCERYFAI